MTKSYIEKHNESIFRPTTPSIKSSFVQRKTTPYHNDKQDEVLSNKNYNNNYYKDSENNDYYEEDYNDIEDDNKSIQPNDHAFETSDKIPRTP